MAETTQNTGTVIQSWVSPELARQVKELADADGRSVSNLIKHILEHELRPPLGEDRRRGRGSSSRNAAPAPRLREGSE